MNKVSMVGVVAALAGVLAACTPPEQAYVEQQPQTRAQRTQTTFSQAIECMDKLLLAHGRRDITITTAGIPDQTGQIQTGTKEMLISAVSRMSQRSGAFRYIDFDPTQVDVFQLQQKLGNQGLSIPNYYIRGAVTQVDQSVLGDRASAGLSLLDFSLGVSADQLVSVVSMDLNMGNLVTRTIIPGTSASNQIALVRTGRAASLDGGAETELVGNIGGSFNIAVDRSEGTGQAVRTLLELTLIEALGKFTKVPYWQCLALDSTNPKVMREARTWYEELGTQELRETVRDGLATAGYLPSATDPNNQRAMQDAIARYQSDNNLIADGRISFELYHSLLVNNYLAESADLDPGLPKGGIEPTRLEVRLTTDRGAQPVYSPGDSLQVRAQVNASGFLYCYYRDSENAIARIYPNRFSSDPFIEGEQTVEIPRDDAGYRIIFPKPYVQEEVVCLATPRDVGLELPQYLKADDLTPIEGLTSLDTLIAEFRRISRDSLAVDRLVADVRS